MLFSKRPKVGDNDPVPYWLFRRALAWAGVVAVGFLIGIGLFLNATNRAASDAKDAADQLLVQRTEARVIACEKDLKFAQGHNNLILYFANLPASPNDTRSPEERAALIEDFKMKNLVPVPDCTPEGIKRFYTKKAR